MEFDEKPEHPNACADSCSACGNYHALQYLLSGRMIHVDIRRPVWYTALDLNGQAAPAKSGSSRSRRRSSEDQRPGA